MKPHIVLIPGAWHSGNCYDVLRPYLQKHGYQTTALTLPSVGAEPPLTSLDPEIAHIRASIIPLMDAGQDIVVVMHSYGGFAGQASLRGLSKEERSKEGKPGGVTALVYLAAFMVDEGQGMRTSNAVIGGTLTTPALKEEGDKFWNHDPIPSLFHDVDPDLAAKVAASLRHHSRPLLFVPQVYAAWKYIPSTYLRCRDDRIIPYERQLKFVELAATAGTVVKTFECDAGHSPFLSQPDFTSMVIRSAAGEDVQVPSSQQSSL